MSKSLKKVRFTSNDDKDENTTARNNNLDQRSPTIDLSVLLNEATSDVGKQAKTKKRKKKTTQFQKLKSEKKKLLKELKKVEKDIRQDSERKSSADYTPHENRHRLARSTSEIHTRVIQLDEKIAIKGQLRNDRIQRSYKTKIKSKTIKAGKQHDRLITMTRKLHDLKINEENIRDEIRQEQTLSSMSKSTSSCHGNASSMSKRTSSCHGNAYLMAPLDDEAQQSWIDVSNEVTPIEEKTGNGYESTRSSPLEMARLSSSLSTTSELSLDEMEQKAQKLAKKYDFTRELRNMIHEHMISRSYSFSYATIIPPYKHKKAQPKKTRQCYNRNIYEDKINVLEYSRKQSKLPAL